MRQDYDLVYNNLEGLNDVITSLNPSKIIVLVDTNTETFCLPIIYDKCSFQFSIIKILPGENEKNIRTCEAIWTKMFDLGVDRKSIIINLGGGVIGDMGGFCASTYMRGIPFIHIPTTLLAQVDASIGGKLGVDLTEYKNIIGSFKNPKAVFISPIFLKTLPYRQLLSGYAEVIKHALIQDKEQFFKLLEVDSIKDLNIKDVIKKSIEIKQRIVNADPKESGLRKILNFGHTIGHAVETFLLPSDKLLYHGEAIAIGMVAESYISFKLGLLKEEDYQLIKSHLKQSFGDKSKSLTDIDSIAKMTLRDKKNSNGEIRMSLLSDIGKSVFDQVVDIELVKESLEAYKN